jgi:hypothetical protein
MFYKNYFIIFIFIYLTNCSSNTLNTNKSTLLSNNNYSNQGFALIYESELYINKIISNKLNERDLIIFQKNLKKNTQVKITNIFNNKSLIASVGKKTNYPSFNNSVVSKRIAKELDLEISEPYVEIVAIPKNSLFIAKRAKTYEEEKNVANKAPVNVISVNDLNEKKPKDKILLKRNFSYIIKVADFYFDDTAIMMKKRIIKETQIKKPKSKKIFDNQYRVYLGPFDNIIALQNSYYAINKLSFENIEILKND